MITRDEYIKALDIVEEYREQTTFDAVSPLCECPTDTIETEYNEDIRIVCKKCKKPLIA